MTLALATLACTIAALFSGLVLGAMRSAIPVRNRQPDMYGRQDASSIFRSSDI
jgi:hypothetical protein